MIELPVIEGQTAFKLRQWHGFRLKLRAILFRLVAPGRADPAPPAMNPCPLKYPLYPRLLRPALRLLAALLGPLMALLAPASPALAAPPTYTLTVLTPGAGQAINNSGQAAGQATNQNGLGGPEHAFLYQNGQVTDLGVLVGASGYSQANAINAGGHVAGYFAAAVQGQSFLYGQGGQVQTFAVPGSASTQALGLNNLDQVVGSYFSTATGHTGAFLRQASGELVDLGILGGSDAAALAINNDGLIVGWLLMADGRHAFLQQPGASAPLDLGNLGLGGTQANAVNDLQQVVGTSAGHAFLYAGGTLNDLGAFGGRQTVAYGINNLSQIVGDYVISSGTEGQSFHGWVYLEGQLYDLNGLLDPAAQGWTIIGARGVNDAGQIIATAVNPSQGNGTFAVILTPEQSLFSACDTPTTVTWNDARAVELGVKFQSAVAGTVTGVRFYKGPQNTGTHVGTLWSATGTVLASATFTEETSSGWQQVNFSNPVPITPGTVYIVSYHTDVGFYSADGNYFATAHPSGPLAAPDSTSSGGNGVYAYGSGRFPTNTCNATNYWVDLVFVAN